MPRVTRRPSDMIAATWVLISALAAHASSLTPPVPAALDTPISDTAAHNPQMSAVPEKRLFTYLLPGTHWASGTMQEGAKRGYGKNYLRFGRSDDDKRGGRNFLRFGRGDSTDYDVSENDLATNEMEKRDRNFLRFGRGPNNYLRFGRAGVETGPLAYGQGLEKAEEVDVGDVEAEESLPAEEKRARNNYLRFGRSHKNFIRFGRGDHRNFLRFGRSVDRQLACEGCQEDDVTPRDTISAPASRTKRAAVMDNEEEDEAKDQQQRMKRSSMRYNDMVAPMPSSYGPSAWARDFQPEDNLDSDDSTMEEQMRKRGYNKSFLRFGRNRNFLRFGKRDTVEDFSPDSAPSSPSTSDETAETLAMMRPDEYPRYIRGQQRNFLRFG